MVGKKFVTPDWNLDHNKNNKLFKLKRNTEYTLTAPQVSNFYYNGSRSEWYNGSKFVMIRKASCRLAAVIGTTGPQAICIDPDSVKKLTVGGTIDLENDTVIYNNSKKPSNTTPAKIINNGDNVDVNFLKEMKK